MKINAYSVQDIKSGRFNAPFFVQSHAEALRMFDQNCKNPETLWNKYPSDFSIFLVGQFDDTTGHLETKELPLFLASALDYVPTPQIVNNGLNDAGKRYVEK